MHSQSKKESTVQVDDDENDSSYNFLLKTESILNTFNKIFGKIFNCNISTKEDDYYETIRSSQKSFQLNDPDAFKKDLTQHRPFILPKAILPPSINHNAPETNKKLLYKEDEEEELFCVLHTDNDCEDILRVYTSDSNGRQEIMKLYVDNEPPKQIVRENESIWKFKIPLKSCQKAAKRTHFTGDGCKLRDPTLIGQIPPSLLFNKDTTENIYDKEVCDQVCQCCIDETILRRGRKKKLMIPRDFF